MNEDSLNGQLSSDSDFRQLTIATRDWSLAGTNTEVHILPFGARESAAEVVRAVAEAELESSVAACDPPNWEALASTELVLADSDLCGQEKQEKRLIIIDSSGPH